MRVGEIGEGARAVLLHACMGAGMGAGMGVSMHACLGECEKEQCKERRAAHDEGRPGGVGVA